jgi:hypothetical protein
VRDEAWGWLPYHHGRWLRQGDLGWVWVPAVTPAFKPGDVYWLYDAKLEVKADAKPDPAQAKKQ